MASRCLRARLALRAGRATGTGARVLVATDDDRIAAHAKEIGVDAVMTDPDLPSGTDRCRAAAELAAPDADFIVNLQGDAPFTPPEHVAALIDSAGKGRCRDACDPAFMVRSTRCVSTRRQRPFPAPPAFVRLMAAHCGSPRAFFLRCGTKRSSRQAGDLSPVLQHIGLYGYSRAALDRIAKLKQSRYEELEGLEQLRFLENGLSVFAVPVAPSQLPSAGIDTPEDAERATRVLLQQGDPFGAA